jgi:hypothetical protein
MFEFFQAMRTKIVGEELKQCFAKCSAVTFSTKEMGQEGNRFIAGVVDRWSYCKILQKLVQLDADIGR